MRSFWGRGALVVGILLGAATIGSYAVGAHLGVPAAPGLAAARPPSPSGNTTSAGTVTSPVPTAPYRPGRGRGPRGPRGPRDFQP